MADPTNEAPDDDAAAAEWADTAENDAQSDDVSAADWEAIPEGGAKADGDLAEAGTTRVLDQNEIDSLLGFDSDDQYDAGQSGIRAIINSALVNYERLPMLDVVFDRLVRVMTTSLRNFTSDNVEVSLDNITSIRFGDYLNSMSYRP